MDVCLWTLPTDTIKQGQNRRCWKPRDAHTCFFCFTLCQFMKELPHIQLLECVVVVVEAAFLWVWQAKEHFLCAETAQMNCFSGWNRLRISESGTSLVPEAPLTQHWWEFNQSFFGCLQISWTPCMFARVTICLGYFVKRNISLKFKRSHLELGSRNMQSQAIRIFGHQGVSLHLNWIFCKILISNMRFTKNQGVSLNPSLLKYS